MPDHAQPHLDGEAGREPAPHAAMVVALAEQRLKNSAYLPLRNLRCSFHEGILVLHGELPSFFLKQMAQSLVAQMAGVGEVLNRVEVRTAVP